MVSHWKVNLEILLIAVLLHHGHGTSSMDCNFDMGWCNWANERQNCFNWTIGYGKSWDRTSGPDADHTTNSSSGLYAVVLGRHSMNSTCTAIIQSPSETFDQKKISFWYHMNGNGIGHLAVFVVENNVRRRIWYREARQGAGWQEASVPLTKGNYMIQFEGTSKLHFGGDLAIDDILIIPDTGPQPTRPQLQRLPLSLPVHCTFDSGNCGFDIKNKYSSVSWTVQKGFISVDNVTYITGDNTTGNGEFLAVVSGKHSMIGDKSTLSLPLIRPQNMTCLTFSYNLPSSTSGYIKVFTKDINTGIDMLLWQKTGYQGRIWKHGSVQIYPSHDLQQVVLEGACTGEPACIIAVDDVNLETGTCKDFHPTTTSSTTTTTVTTATTTTQPTTTTKGTTTQPPTTQLPGLSFKSATSCHPVYTSFIPELSCDFTNSFCNYTQTDINIDWEIKNKQYGGWLAKIPARNTSDGDYLALNLSTYQIKTGEAILKSPLINQDAICVEFWYSMPSFSSNLKMEVESSNGGKTTIWKKSGSQNHGMWTKESLLVNYNSKYKLAFLGDKTTSISFVGIDDIHVYGKGKASTTTGPVRWNITNAPERHDITCSVDSMSVYVPMSVLSTNDLLTWRDPHCQVSNNGTHFVSTIQHSACGTTVSFNTDEVIFENELIIHKQSPQRLIQLNDTAQIDFGLPNNDIVPVRCVYPRNMNVTTSYRPAQSHIRFYEKRYGHLDVVLEQFKTDQFLTELPGRSYPREVELNKDLFFKLRASHVNSSDVALKVDSCIATPSLFPASSQTYELIKQGCPASPAVKLFASSFDEVRFSVRAFEFRKSPGGVVYIHCQVSLCSSASSQCVTGCSSRHRREAVGTDGPSQLISGGPYMVVADEGSIQASTVVAAVCACIAVISTVFAVVGWKRKTERSAA